MYPAMMVHRPGPRIGSLILAAAFFVPTAAWCGFKCKPPNSTTIYRENLPAECKDVEIVELYPDGSVKRVIPAPLTPEQRRKKQEDERKRDDCNKRNQDRARKDNSLLSTYPIEEDLLAARDRALANKNMLIDQQNEKLKELKAEFKRLQDEGEFYARRQMPEELKRNLDGNAALRDQAAHAIGAILAEMERISQSFDADLQRYRELVAGTAQLPCKPEP